jgi:nucleotide-binding universal stress UspA family protein
VVVASDVAGALADLAIEVQADLLALGTHGRGGLGRWLYGSVTDRVAHGARVPVLLFRPPDARPETLASGPPAAAVRR